MKLQWKVQYGSGKAFSVWQGKLDIIRTAGRSWIAGSRTYEKSSLTNKCQKEKRRAL